MRRSASRRRSSSTASPTADYVFHLGPVGKRLRDKRAKVKLPLSQRQREVLDFAIKSCRGADLDLKATAAKRTGRLSAPLQLPSDCADTG